MLPNFEKETQSLITRGFSRRQVGKIFSAISAGAAALPFTEFAQAQQAERRAGGARGMMDSSFVRTSSRAPSLSPAGSSAHTGCIWCRTGETSTNCRPRSCRSARP